MTNNTIIRFENISKVYSRKKEDFFALKDVSFDIKKGDIYGFVGFSGAGKSTLLRMVNALETPTSGKVIVNGTTFGEFSMGESEIKDMVTKLQPNAVYSKTVKNEIHFSQRTADKN